MEAPQFLKLTPITESPPPVSELSITSKELGKFFQTAHEVYLSNAPESSYLIIECRYVKGVVRDIMHDPGRGAPLAKVVFRD
jgi:ribosomal protein L2